jgi:hypothetical protein
VCKLASALVLAISLLAGCGSNGDRTARLSHDEYLQRLREIESGGDAQSATRLFLKLVVEPGAPQTICLERARQFDRALHNIVLEVDSLQPPESVQSLQDRFVSEARKSVAAVDDAVEDVDAGTLTCGMPMNRRIYGLPSTERAEAVLIELGKRGYTLGSNSE